MYPNCRVCLKEDVETTFTQFSGFFNHEMSVYECYRDFTSICLYSDEDKMESRICPDCLIQLIKFHKYRCQAQMNNQLILNMEGGTSSLDQPGTSFFKEENDKEFSVRYIPLDDPLQPVHLAKVKMELPDDLEMGDENIDSDPDYQSFEDFKMNVEAEDIKCKSETKERIIKHIPGHINIRELFFDYLAHGKLLESENEMKDLKKRKIICNYCDKKYSYTSFKGHCMNKHPSETKTPSEEKYQAQSQDLYFEYLAHGKLLEEENDIKDLKKRKIICNYCQRKFAYTSFRGHCQTVHPNEKKYPTQPNQDTPGQLDESTGSLIEPLIGPPVIRCEYLNCSAEFRFLGALNMHVKNVHLKIRKFICTTCGKGFFLTTDLKEHETTHLEHFNHVCEICAEKFKSHRKLARHKAMKHEPPKYRCSICNKSCASQKRAKEHENLHQGIRDYACTHCEKNYTSSKHLRTHIRDSHFKSKISCEICNSKLARVENYTNHVKTVHKDLGQESMDALLGRIKRITPNYDLMDYEYN